MSIINDNYARMRPEAAFFSDFEYSLLIINNGNVYRRKKLIDFKKNNSTVIPLAQQICSLDSNAPNLVWKLKKSLHGSNKPFDAGTMKLMNMLPLLGNNNVFNQWLTQATPFFRYKNALSLLNKTGSYILVYQVTSGSISLKYVN